MVANAMKENAHIDDVFERWPVRKAVGTLAAPAVISQLITSICSLADTFFVGWNGTDTELAAISVSYTALLIFNVIANLFGVGGSSLLARALGEHDEKKASQAAAFSLWGALLLSGLYALLAALFPRLLARIFGASDLYLEDTCTYLHYGVVLGAVPVVLVMVLGHLIRAEGGSRQASVGLCVASVIKLALNPLLISPHGLDMGIAGAALATTLAHWLALGYFLVYVLRRRGQTAISFHPAWLRGVRAAAWDVFLTGFPQSIKTAMSALSGAAMNHLAVPFGECAVAAIGIAQKFDMLPMNVATGFSTGAMPMIGYTYASRSYDRLKKALSYAQRCALCVSGGFLVLYMLFSPALTRVFVQDEQTAQMSAQFLRVLALALPGMTVSFTFTALFQATGRAREALILSLYRKGAVDIPLMLLLDAVFPLRGLVMAQPIVDTTAALLAWRFYRRFIRELDQMQGGESKCSAKA